MNPETILVVDAATKNNGTIIILSNKTHFLLAPHALKKRGQLPRLFCTRSFRIRQPTDLISVYNTLLFFFEAYHRATATRVLRGLESGRCRCSLRDRGCP